MTSTAVPARSLRRSLRTPMAWGAGFGVLQVADHCAERAGLDRQQTPDLVVGPANPAPSALFSFSRCPFGGHPFPEPGSRLNAVFPTAPTGSWAVVGRPCGRRIASALP
jgi:hypothetical protein